jgi:hypothetical protein
MSLRKPKTTPECEQLLELVLAGLRSNPIEGDKQESARVALKRLKKNRCVKALEYIMSVSSGHIMGFEVEVCRTAREYLDELT